MAAYTTIDDPEEYFSVTLYTGTGSENAVTGVGFSADLTWLKARDNTTSHYLFDTVRGATKAIWSDTFDEEAANVQYHSAWGSDGFTIGTNTGVNNNTTKYVTWNWVANGTGSTNEAGSINTTATSANTTSGFSIITYTGNGTSGATIGHGLGVAPTFIALKTRSMSGGARENWRVYHDKNTSAPATDYLALNTNAATADDSNAWNDTVPSSTLITLGNGGASNTNTETYVAYCWADVQGYSKFGSYEGNGNADGPFVYLGFRPAFVIFKSVDSVENWIMLDNKRNGYNEASEKLYPNTTVGDEETKPIDLLSNGFKIRTADGDFNTNANTHIYAAFAEAPFVNSEGVPCNAR